MAFNPSPTGYFSGIANLASGNSVSTSGVFIPYDNLESYNVATSGDIRQLAYSFIEALSSQYSSLSTADRPTKMLVTKTSVVPNNNTIRNTYNITFNLVYDELSVDNE